MKIDEDYIAQQAKTMLGRSAIEHKAVFDSGPKSVQWDSSNHQLNAPQ